MADTGDGPPTSVITTPSPSYTPVLYAQAELTDHDLLAQRHPNLHLTPEEKRVFFQLFQAADTTNLGVITGEIAVPFFEKTHLSPDTLGLIWQIADKENRGLLTPSGFGIVLRLIGHAQAGRTPSDELALQSGPLPRFDGIVVDTAASIPESGTKSPPPGANGPIRVPPLQPDDANKFVQLFEKSDVKNGMISGEVAKQIFERARLPNEVLGRIWFLSDTKQRGALDATEFTIAMHLLTSYKSGALRNIPATLPPGLYDAAARRGSARGSFGSRPNVPPIPAIPQQFTGPQRTASPMNQANRMPFGGSLSAQATGGDWLITPQEKAQFDSIFETVDTAKLGLITGDQAVSFFMKAQLPEETLAQIWDLADIDADGQLSRDEFAVAMYLVRMQRSGKEPLPQVVPPALIPPSMRRQVPAPMAAPTPPPAPAPAVRSAADDLFGLDTPAPPFAQPQMPQSTGGSNNAFQTPGSPSSRASPQTASHTFKPFVPTSTFGQSLQPQITGASAGTPAGVRSPPPPSDDLLGDNDPEESNKLTNETTELANLSNQIGSLAKEMHTVQEKRTTAEQSITQTSQQKRDFEARLAQARSMYEQEVTNFKALEERLKSSKAETQKLQQQYALLDGSRQDLQNQYTQVSTALAADEQENASLKEKIRQANAEVAQLKPVLEKARSSARQQKGLVAINKKQLATVEGERDKLQGEIDDLARETPQYSEESVTPAGSVPEVTSPAASTASQNTNPFFRRTGSSSDQARSPDVSNDQQRAFESLFGQSFAAAPAAGPPPTSFRSESPQVAVTSPVTSAVTTPSVSPPPGSLPGAFPVGPFSEPPPASQSRQLTPNFLQFNDSQSVTSSTMVSPPASRFGGPEAPGFDTPSQAATSDFGPQSVAESSDYSHAPTSSTLGGTPARSPFEEEGQETSAKFPEIPAATAQQPEPATSPIAKESEVEASKDLSFDELFGSKAHKRSESQQGNDFEEAFASMKPVSGAERTNGAASAGASEFPPIQELHHDDDDDESSDDEGAFGFDDNFTPPAPVATKETKQDSLDAAQLAAFPVPGSTNKPPSPGEQQSPPEYEAHKADNVHLPSQFNGLLPERVDPTVAPDAPHSVEHTTGAPVVSNETQKDSISGAAIPSGGAKVGGPDFEAAFAGMNLAPAAEADDDDDDEPLSQEAKNTTDFDFSFDSPSQKQQAVSGADASQSSSSQFFAFDNNVHASAAPPVGSPNEGETKPASHEWDALFAPLNNSKPDAGEDSNGAKSKEPGWALNNDTGDDLILQRLTGMGFTRDESLDALEKFDYNLDKAADHLTSKT
ncbi:Calcium-binding EF-hand [Penicillium griseofulvum]|uniref:Actin cytoskeleton-regulatory complex protein END3 n=1 Tax=Penicillium patulum TaxID=5078 RepID=A0A135LYZ6_PENPA|nr:Calcium-binding EF-hand [Penicillium griseofulvum]KXG54183.1 Calcium-binding EF-hand [Penicillium griseofulvum]